ncbi:DUF711 family protein [Infirmifilum uzonense]|uniref:DUF711 family protein n=1 Tax=Infirmifilum uzonense TaxID=1550241 RepID=UPI000699D3FA|nr:DUF711 family protein [Infirmifilum uzonense]
MTDSIDIRAAVLHVNNETIEDRKKLSNSISRFLEGLDNFTRTTSLKVVSKRIVAAPIHTYESARLAIGLYEEAEANGINYVGLPILKTDPEKTSELLENYPRLFISTEYKPEDEGKIVETLRRITEKSHLQATRYAVSFGPLLQTPYFPATRTIKEGVTLSLLYVEAYAQSRLPELKRLLENLQANAASSWPNFIGTDFSLSPWMERSVASLVERISGVMFTLPGTIAAIRRINRDLEDLSRSLRSTGFNELMLPLAEDNRLKELARLGQLRLSHLINYASYCVAGLDMVVIPDSTENTVLEGILRDLWEIHLLKKKTIGMRIILAPNQEGEEIDLGMFGKTPVISPLT